MVGDFLLALDIGGSKLMVALMDQEGRIHDWLKKEWAIYSEEELIYNLVSTTRELLAGHREKKFSALGVTIPGLADPGRGLWIEAVFSGLGNIRIKEILEEEFNLPVYVDNDGQACALAEKVFGRCQNNSDFLYLTVSNGVGGGIFVNNSLYYGGYGSAGEIGHIVVEEKGRLCGCGSRGCLEMYASGPGIVKNYLKLAGDAGSNDGLDARTLAQLARGGNSLALKTYEQEGSYLAKALASAVNLLNPQKIVVGGGVSQSFDLFENSLRKELSGLIYRKANEKLLVEASDFGQNGGLYGAAALAVCGPSGRFNWGKLAQI